MNIARSKTSSPFRGYDGEDPAAADVRLFLRFAGVRLKPNARN
jgi:hypothetical protein